MKSMDTFLILLSVMLTFSLNLTAQVLPRNPTVSDISSFKDDISVRKKNVPRDQAEILDERRWLTTASTQIRELKNNYENNEKPDLDKFKNELIGLVEEIIEIDCNNLAQSKEELERILFKYQSLRRHRKIILNIRNLS